jgi:hypothetical protein
LKHHYLSKLEIKKKKKKKKKKKPCRNHPLPPLPSCNPPEKHKLQSQAKKENKRTTIKNHEAQKSVKPPPPSIKTPISLRHNKTTPNHCVPTVKPILSVIVKISSGITTQHHQQPNPPNNNIE